MLRPCLGDPRTGRPCNRLTRATRCAEHARTREADRHNRLYDSTRWHRLRDSVIAVHVARYGPWCPADGGHDLGPDDGPLTADHRIPWAVLRASGGDFFDRANLDVTCRRHNSAKGARV